ncbi:LysR family transcriptional regulator [Chondromyces crocatus]|uniref:LysR family transcriptional regulator n=1 Tax=Chondromyces crocatus TaxID=52 RepID=UPI00067AA604|nr:LysR family transcriptional regulator [Chondromyces crocatus]
MSDRLRGVVSFVQAAEAGSFALAAQRMGQSRSAVGKAVIRLEEQLGVRLFHRTTRALRLTDDGQAFYERCSRALAELEAAEALLERGRKEPAGRLRVSVPVLFGRRCVAPILVEVAQEYPQIALEVSFTDRCVDLVEEGVELAIRGGPLADSAGLMSRRLGKQVMVVCGSPEYLADRGTPDVLDELALHEGLVYGREGRVVPWRLLDAEGHARELTLPSRIRFDDLEAIAAAAVAGAGLAWLPCWLVADALRAGTLVPVLEGERAFGYDIHAVWPLTQHLPSRVRVAIDALVARVPERLHREG